MKLKLKKTQTTELAYCRPSALSGAVTETVSPLLTSGHYMIGTGLKSRVDLEARPEDSGMFYFLTSVSFCPSAQYKFKVVTFVKRTNAPLHKRAKPQEPPEVSS